MPTGRSTTRRSGNPIPSSLWAPGIRVLSLYVYGPTSFASLRPIRAMDDFRGKKIRVLASKMETALVGKLGATGVPHGLYRGAARPVAQDHRRRAVEHHRDGRIEVLYRHQVHHGRRKRSDPERHLRQRGVAEENFPRTCSSWCWIRRAEWRRSARRSGSNSARGPRSSGRTTAPR